MDYITRKVKALGETKLYSCHAIENPNSGKVMEKAGFHYVSDGHYDSFDGTRHYATREYVLERTEKEEA